MALTITNPRRRIVGKDCQRPAPGHRRMPLPAPPPPPPPTTTRALRSQANILTQTMMPAHATYAHSGVGRGKKITKRRKRLDPWYPKRKVNKNCKPRAPSPTHFTCLICISYLPVPDFIRWVHPKHARSIRNGHLDAPLPCIPNLARNPSRLHTDPVCKICVGSFMAARLDTLGPRRVSVGCIEPGCETVWPWELLMKYFPSDKLEAYNLASFEAWRTDTDLFTCLSPTCTSTGLLDPSAPVYPQVQCPTRHLRSCASCLTPWHTSQTCAEVAASAITSNSQMPGNEALALMQSKDGCRCPNCHLVIEKDGGCPSMFCSGCKEYFKWETAATAVPGTKRALPVASGLGYWQTPGAVCEIDRQKGRVGDVDMDVDDGGVGYDTFLYAQQHLGGVELPLPEEADADL